jgi:hypothetical protein
MPQHDLVLNEVRKLALLLARLMGLKAEGQHEEYKQNFDEVLQSEYNIELEQLLQSSEADFKNILIKEKYSAEKLNALSQLLFVFAEPFKADEETALILKKVLIIFDLLETEHRYESFENLNKRKTIHHFFINNYERP